MTSTVPGQSISQADRLRELGNTIQSSINAYITQLGEGSSESNSLSNTSPIAPPSHNLLTAQRSIIAATGQLNSIVLSAEEQLVLLSAQHLEARVLHIIVAADIAGILSKKGTSGEMEIEELAKEAGLEKGKLARMLRLLCSLNIFQEVRQNVFANNEVSVKLAGDENFRAWVITFGLPMFSAANELPTYLFHSDGRGHSYDSGTTPLAQCMRYRGKMFEWYGQKVRVGDVKEGRNGVGVAYESELSTALASEGGGECNGTARERGTLKKEKNANGFGSVKEEKDKDKEGSFRNGYPGAYGTFLRDAIEGKGNDELVERPELRTHRMAMIGAGESGMMAEYEGFPWASLNNATVVDVGSGVGGFSIRLSKLFPQLKIVLQDQPHMIKQAETAVWPTQNPGAISQGRVRFVPHDFFTPNPVKEAEVYYIRNVLLDWADPNVATILENVRVSMGKKSRVLISEIMLPTTAESGPATGPKNYGHHHRYAYIHDIAMMLGHNGRCRTPAQFGELGQKAGLKVRNVWECKGHGGLVELVLPDSEL